MASHPSQSPSTGEIESLINRLQRRDTQHFFRDPVTDDVVSCLCPLKLNIIELYTRCRMQEILPAGARLLPAHQAPDELLPNARASG